MAKAKPADAVPAPGGGGAQADGGSKGDAGGSPLDGFVKRMQVYNDFVRAVGEFKLNAAQADLAEAQAAGEYEKAMILETVRTQLAIDLSRLNDELKASSKKIAEVSSLARYALNLLQGKRLGSSYGRVRDAYKYFETRAMIESDASLFAPLSLAGAEITGDDFLDNHDESKPCVSPKPADLRNVLTLINWSFKMEYLARPGTSAMQQFARLFQAIGSVAEGTIARVNTYRDQIKSDTYKTWNPVQLVGLEPTPSQKSILENPGPNRVA